MCLLSFKMNNQDLDEILTLDNKALYSKCVKQEKKEFHEFQSWIQKEVNKIRFQKIYEKNRQFLEEMKEKQQNESRMEKG